MQTSYSISDANDLIQDSKFSWYRLLEARLNISYSCLSVFEGCRRKLLQEDDNCLTHVITKITVKLKFRISKLYCFVSMSILTFEST